MDLLISMKAEPIEKGLEPICNVMTMPTAQSEGYFIAEFREAEPEKLKFLQQLAIALNEELSGDKDLLIETTPLGFKIKKSVGKDNDYMEAWEKWVSFSRLMYDRLTNIIKETEQCG
ncbi:MAG TPA: hypothetical protein VHT73_12675 [Thermodesulfobacteriota bacterium]|nr:hypothetical protein [Thermodesulfobacteriota bacterium]